MADQINTGGLRCFEIRHTFILPCTLDESVGVYSVRIAHLVDQSDPLKHLLLAMMWSTPKNQPRLPIEQLLRPHAPRMLIRFAARLALLNGVAVASVRVSSQRNGMAYLNTGFTLSWCPPDRIL